MKHETSFSYSFLKFLEKKNCISRGIFIMLLCCDRVKNNFIEKQFIVTSDFDPNSWIICCSCSLLNKDNSDSVRERSSEQLVEYIKYIISIK